ncbi:MAG TPA: hypothetical protein DEA08_00555 [Planctomycetes bacterium]|nr:hypothetical protein [Planctomycetota bacterium]
MSATCPYCKEDFASRRDGVRCAECATPHHEACWDEVGGTCTVLGCTSRSHLPFTRRAAGRIVIKAGRLAAAEVVSRARERLGGKTLVALFLFSLLIAALPLAPALFQLRAKPLVQLQVLLAGVFVLLVAWITALLYRGPELTHDLGVEVADDGLGSYYTRLWEGLGLGRGGGSGCGDLSGCSNVSSGEDALGLLVVLLVVLGVAVALLVVLPLVAWLALELIGPLVVLAVYWICYGALVLAAGRAPGLRGRLLPCLARGVIYAALYTSIVGGLLAAALVLSGKTLTS